MKPIPLIAMILSAGLVTGASTSTSTTAVGQREELVSAAVVYNIARFSTWPTELAGPTFDVCLDARSGPIEAFRTIEGKAVGTAAVRVVPLAREELGRVRCHVVFISRVRNYEDQLAAVNRAGTLTVGRAEDFLDQGGAIRLTTEGRPRFSVNVRAAQAAGVNPSSKLLQLAEEVVR